MIIRLAAKAELSQVDQMLQEAAVLSEGFGVDEFTQEGYYSRKMFFESRSFVVETEYGDLAGCGVFGSSRLARNRDIAVASYICIKEQYRRVQIGSHLMKYFTSLAHRLDFILFYQDVLMIPGNHHLMIDMLLKQGFMVSGTLPRCAFVKEVGPVDSLLLYKFVKPQWLKSLL